jgi:hypothetical protein
VCINSSEYNITLVGTVEILVDQDTKKENWFPVMEGMWSGFDDPNYCVLRFTTERYNLFIIGCEGEARGTLKDMEKETKLSVTPCLGFNGQCNQAIELYKEAFGAKVIEKLHYSEADPKDFQCQNEAEKDFVFYSEIMIGNQRIMLGDDCASVDERSTPRN